MIQNTELFDVDTNRSIVSTLYRNRDSFRAPKPTLTNSYACRMNLFKCHLNINFKLRDSV